MVKMDISKIVRDWKFLLFLWFVGLLLLFLKLISEVAFKESTISIIVVRDNCWLESLQAASKELLLGQKLETELRKAWGIASK